MIDPPLSKIYLLYRIPQFTRFVKASNLINVSSKRTLESVEVPVSEGTDFAVVDEAVVVFAFVVDDEVTEDPGVVTSADAAVVGTVAVFVVPVVVIGEEEASV